MGLRVRGITPGDRVGLMSPNRVDWIVANLGILSAGGVTVPIYATQAHDQVDHILADSEARLLFVDADRSAEALRTGGVRLPPVVSFDASGEDGLAALEAAGRMWRRATSPFSSIRREPPAHPRASCSATATSRATR